ncbi:hypothetical protein T05_737 [Trichinella murrelli]|uniref:Uncharacterized protein n=1 Tax=Trichinella murrelli TaxID=144512 RepID=A0A0V0T329_9BILA|nr:hypothetical protein T05_737 [Trichinella murrelli]
MADDKGKAVERAPIEHLRTKYGERDHQPYSSLQIVFASRLQYLCLKYFIRENAVLHMQMLLKRTRMFLDSFRSLG